MSDYKAIYRKVKEFVKCLYPGGPRGFFHRNLNTLTSMITGIIIGYSKLVDMRVFLSS